MLFNKITVVDYNNHMKPTNTLYVQNAVTGC